MKPIFHRGHVLAGREENTVPAIDVAVEKGGGVEIDVQYTLDNYCIIMHDTTWDRTTPETGQVSETLFDVANAYVTDGGNDVPSLKNALAHAKPGVATLLDVKGDASGWPAEAISRIQVTVSDLNALANTYVYSESPDFLLQLGAQAPRLKKLWRASGPFLVSRLVDLGVDGVLARAEVLTQAKVDNLNDAGMKVYVQKWSVKTKAEFQRIAGLTGVDGMIIEAADWNAWT